MQRRQHWLSEPAPLATVLSRSLAMSLTSLCVGPKAFFSSSQLTALSRAALMRGASGPPRASVGPSGRTGFGVSFGFLGCRGTGRGPSATGGAGTNGGTGCAATALFEAEYRRRLFRWAADEIRDEFTQTTWRAFWQTAVEGRPPNEVAAELRLSIGSVYVARSRVLSRLRHRIEQVGDETASMIINEVDHALPVERL